MNEKNWFVFDPQTGTEFFSQASDAQKRAEAILQRYQEQAAECGWDEQGEQVCWGEVKGRVDKKLYLIYPEIVENREESASGDSVTSGYQDLVIQPVSFQQVRAEAKGKTFPKTSYLTFEEKLRVLTEEGFEGWCEAEGSAASDHNDFDTAWAWMSRVALPSGVLRFVKISQGADFIKKTGFDTSRADEEMGQGWLEKEYDF